MAFRALRRLRPVARGERPLDPGCRRGARGFGAHVEGGIQTITGVGSDVVAKVYPLEVAFEFIQYTGVDVFAPAIGNAHGLYHAEPEPTLDLQRVSDLVEKEAIPIALHGGTGMSEVYFRGLVARGCAKVNISTALKRSFMQACHEFLEAAAERDEWGTPSFFAHARRGVVEMARASFRSSSARGCRVQRSAAPRRRAHRRRTSGRDPARLERRREGIERGLDPRLGRQHPQQRPIEDGERGLVAGSTHYDLAGRPRGARARTTPRCRC